MDAAVLGAGGTLGTRVCAELARRGHRPLAIPRAQARDAEAIARIGAPLIVNCAGASVALGLGRGWRGYGAVDVPIGLAAVAAARASGARLVYVAVHHPREMRDCAYVAAHERVATAMAAIDGTVVRATGFFSAFAALLPVARRGWLFDLGDGRARTNPIADGDLAEIVVDVALGREGPRDVAAGGPEILTRRQIFEQVAATAQRRVRIVGAPVWPAALGAVALRAVHPRLGQFVQFATRLARHDVIAPALGTTRLASYLTQPPATSQVADVHAAAR